MRTLTSGLLAFLSMIPSTPSQATAVERPTAAVALGESFFAGNAGRWAGNTLATNPSLNGTDRAFDPATGTVDPQRVYGPNYDAGCYRSDVAPILSADLPVDRRINLSCSGATTVNVFRSVAGGQPRNGEPPQADRLAAVAATNDVKLIVLNLGGNDLGFGPALLGCVVAFETAAGSCKGMAQSLFDVTLPAMKTNLGKAIDEIRAVMSAAGKPPATYRLVLTTYPSVLPRGTDNRYAEDDGRFGFGCPFYDTDLDWARDLVVPQLSDALTAVAGSRGVQVLDMRNAMQGREICAKGVGHVGPAEPNSALHEWAYWNDFDGYPGDQAESMHPNLFGQRAWGRCVSLIYAAAAGDYRCVNAGPGSTDAQMSLQPAPKPLGPNLALDRPVEVSSVQFASFRYGEYAVDGDLGSRWSSKYEDPQWIRVDLGSSRAIGSVRLFWEAAFARAYRIEVSNNDSSWTTVFSTSFGNGGVDHITFTAPPTARYVRVLGTARGTDYGYSLWNFEVFGKDA